MFFFALASPQVYERGTNVEQFVTRFLLKESANQIQSLLSSVESAVDAIDEQHSQSGWANENHRIMCKTQIGSAHNCKQAVFQAQISAG